MMTRASDAGRALALAFVLAIALTSGSARPAATQQPPVRDTTRTARDTLRADSIPDVPAEPDTSVTWGAFDAGEGFEVARTKFGNLRISGYALVRYINQRSSDETFTDHLGRERVVDTRNDIQFHRVMVHFRGWIYDPKVRYTMTVWTVNSTQQIAIVGNLSYRFNDRLNIYAGINGLPGTRSLGGSHPYWLAHDRVMADEYFRPGFTSGVWLDGWLLPRTAYRVMVGNNISTLGITAGEDDRNFALSGSLWWMPTTGEFGPKGGYGDWEYHEKLATRFGGAFTHSREDRYSQNSNPSPDNTQIRISDGVLAFETGALADGVTLEKADYDLLSLDASFKYRGLFGIAEFYHRTLTNFEADGPLPLSSMRDVGFMVQLAGFPRKQKLEVYGATSQIWGEFNRSWEVVGGLNWFPVDNRNMRVNAQGIYVDKSAAGSLFGFYLGGHSGFTSALAFSVMF